MQRLYKMGHYPSTVYHYVVDRSMALLAMTLCYSKHKALRQPPCLLWRLQQGSTHGKGTHSQEASGRKGGRHLSPAAQRHESSRGGGLRGKLKGLKGNNIRQEDECQQRQEKDEGCPRATSPPPNPLPPLSSADKHMWADNMTLPVKRGREREDQEPRVGLTSKMLTADGGGLGSHSHFSTSPHPKRHGEAFINSSLPFTCSFSHCLSYLPSRKLSCFCQNEKPSLSLLCEERESVRMCADRICTHSGADIHPGTVSHRSGCRKRPIISSHGSSGGVKCVICAGSNWQPLLVGAELR
ncbi:hypothetical protein CRENBAI_004667 [Crenichthys baileyi]|uniref:Uncharacterized protein n=1 Tax=Crenichthys baileyi TaxID=28760 RepID=A0AAV9RBJ4_9TELE